MTAENRTNSKSDTAPARAASDEKDGAGNGVASPVAKGRSTAEKGAAKAAAQPEQTVSKAKEAAGAGLENGRQALSATAGQVTSTAVTAWSVVKHRKAIVTGTAAGLAGMLGGAFLLGRRSAERNSTWATWRRTARDTARSALHRK
ncbi:hypothetical protein DY218_32055 [Streptomyces triticagri]|uniref:Uncharacterized protein n=1 Tax=Streptomyces triticagri TaxID=2293568 RepID=A0A372LVJ3_9ACTN|nr:hypothetical protein [Streptomyces triticagri]RFU82671.1 hypothetical protein DY218_32055 [Streptomyces triticagri]